MLDLTTFPRIIWAYWHAGQAALSPFRRRCVSTWQAKNPTWRIEILDQQSLAQFLDPDELPSTFPHLHPVAQSDAVRLALLAKHGGVWMDVSIICLQPLDMWLLPELATYAQESQDVVGGFYNSAFGVAEGLGREFVENWFLAASRRHPLVCAWRDLLFQYWSGRTRSEQLQSDPMFQHVELAHMTRNGMDFRDYLTMHCCFKKLIDERPEMREVWAKRMALRRAEDTALLALVLAGWDPLQGCTKWICQLDGAWVARMQRETPILKFTSPFTQLLDTNTAAHFECLNSMSKLLLDASRGGSNEDAADASPASSETPAS